MNTLIILAITGIVCCTLIFWAIVAAGAQSDRITSRIMDQRVNPRTDELVERINREHKQAIVHGPVVRNYKVKAGYHDQVTGRVVDVIETNGIEPWRQKQNDKQAMDRLSSEARRILNGVS